MRQPAIAVISDVHLGTDQCLAAELEAYLDQVQPETLIVNGDLFDMTHHDPKAWGELHLGLIERLLAIAGAGSTVYYVTGNHDHLLRRYSGLIMGPVRLVDHIELELDGRRYLVTHGDIFDLLTCSSPWLRHFGGWLYERVMRCGNLCNRLHRWLGLRPFSLARFVKQHIAGERFVRRFVEGAADHAARHGYDGIVCGHIHAPGHETVMTGEGAVEYLNSGDWVEHATALEYDAGGWRLHRQPRLAAVRARRRLPRHLRPTVVVQAA